MNPFIKRSSLPSSYLTGLIGWICFILVGTLVFDIRISFVQLALLSAAIAVVQVSLLRILFFTLRMQRHILIGALWGFVTAVLLYFVLAFIHPEMKEQQWYWLILFAYIGAPVGAFLSYFYIDDQKILAASGKKQETFGRDAHWLEPFAFGAVAYVIVFLPFANWDIALKVFVIGAITGVFAAGSSHFSPDKWKRSVLLLSLIIVLIGGIIGGLTGLLFRSYTAYFHYSPIVHGSVAGMLTYLMTFLRGRQLAVKEEQGLL